MVPGLTLRAGNAAEQRRRELLDAATQESMATVAACGRASATGRVTRILQCACRRAPEVVKSARWRRLLPSGTETAGAERAAG